VENRPETSIRLEVRNLEGKTAQIRVLLGATAAVNLPEPVEEFRRGDVDMDGLIGLTDVIRAVTYQFVGGVSLDCLDAADVDDDGELTLTDAIRSLTYQFVGTAGTEPEPPGPIQCGPDVNADEFPPCGYPADICK
jgi:hypothetical protein